MEADSSAPEMPPAGRQGSGRVPRPLAYALAVVIPVVLVLGGAWWLNRDAEPAPPSVAEVVSSDAAQLVEAGQAAFAAGDLQAAQASFASAAQRDPANTWIAFNLGAVADAMGDRATAITQYQAAIALDPANALAHYNLGVAHAASGDIAAAKRSYSTVLTLEPQNASAMWNLGLLLYDEGELDAARDLLRRGAELNNELLARLPANVQLQ